MSDADGRVIPYTEDDQGEGVKDPLTLDDLLDLQFNETALEHQKEFHRQLLGNEFKVPAKENLTKRDTGEPVARWVLPEDSDE